MTGFSSRAPQAAVPAAEPKPLPAALVSLGLLLYGIVGVLSALIEVLLVPIRIGTVLVPIAVLLTVGSNIVVPRLSRMLTVSALGALPPVLCWIVTAVILSSTRREGDVLLPGGGDVQWVSYGVLLGGVLTGLITTALLYGAASSSYRAADRRRAATAQPRDPRTR